MNIKTYFILTTISCILFGLGFLVVPGVLASLHGFDHMDDYATLVMRLYGGGLISTGIMAWAVKEAGPSIARKSILLYLIIFDVFNTVLNLIFMTNNGAQPINYLELVVTVSFGVLAFYFWRKE